MTLFRRTFYMVLCYWLQYPMFYFMEKRLFCFCINWDNAWVWPVLCSLESLQFQFGLSMNGADSAVVSSPTIPTRLEVCLHHPAPSALSADNRFYDWFILVFRGSLRELWFVGFLDLDLLSHGIVCSLSQIITTKSSR